MELVPIGWRDLGRQVHGVVEEVRTRTGEAPLIVGLDRYFIASELAFYAPDQVQSVKGTSSGHLFGAMGLMYERWFPPQSQQGRTLLLVAWDAKDLAGPSIESRVQRLDPIRDGVVTRDGGVIRPFHYRVAYEYRDIPKGE
jgi:dolichol-phosphate mannosyltransferase